jgi:hypothetical protein
MCSGWQDYSQLVLEKSRSGSGPYPIDGVGVTSVEYSDSVAGLCKLL